MTDYKCPNCGGGFPTSAAVDDECPWCARGMEGGSDPSPTLQPTPPHRRDIDISPPSIGEFDHPLGGSPVDFDGDEPINIPHLRLDDADDYTGRTGGWR